MDDQERPRKRLEAKSASHARPLRERVESLLYFALPLVCWPNLERPFSTPKLWVLTGIGLLALTRVRGPRTLTEARIGAYWPAVVWIAVVSLSAILSVQALLWPLAAALLPVASFWTGCVSSPRLASILRTLWFATLVESGIALLQFSGYDPLRLVGWTAESFPAARMQVYGSLGNPDFVAAWICALLPAGALWTLHAGDEARMRWGRVVGLFLAVSAVAATGSRIVWLVLPLQFMVLYGSKGPLPRMRRVLWAPVLAMALLLALLPLQRSLRSLRTTLSGRLYLAHITLSGWRAIPLLGFGPGAYAEQFVRWQDRRAEENPQAAAAENQFAGRTEHAHNDPLEFLVEFGWMGAAVETAVSLWAVRRFWVEFDNATSACWWAAAAGVVTLAGTAMVDFPLHRPAEASMFWLYLGALAAHGQQAQTSLSS